jgi:hypothetical protein
MAESLQVVRAECNVNEQLRKLSPNLSEALCAELDVLKLWRNSLRRTWLQL